MTIYRNKTKTLVLHLPHGFCLYLFLIFFRSPLLVHCLWLLGHPWVFSATFTAIIISSSRSPKHISGCDFSLGARPLEVHWMAQGHPNLTPNWTHYSLFKLAPLLFSILTNDTVNEPSQPETSGAIFLSPDLPFSIQLVTNSLSSMSFKPTFSFPLPPWSP